MKKNTVFMDHNACKISYTPGMVRFEHVERITLMLQARALFTQTINCMASGDVQRGMRRPNYVLAFGRGENGDIGFIHSFLLHIEIYFVHY